MSNAEPGIRHVTASAIVFDDHTTHPLPFLILEVDVSDPDHGPHRYIDALYVLRAAGGEISAALDEVGGARWEEIKELPTRPEIPGLIARAADWAAGQQGLAGP